jgi:SAM-dependent methyltransferase
MLRVAEAELMDDGAQARAYAAADFEAPHDMFVELLELRIPADARRGNILDLGCGPADVTIRFARRNAACRVTGIDGAPSMIDLGVSAVQAAGLADRIALEREHLPLERPWRHRYDGLLSNALLHHLHDPCDLWRTVRSAAGPGAWMFVMDLLRPASVREASRLVETYAAAEPEILKRDFYNSLLAAYEPAEVREQLERCGQAHATVETVSDRHWIAWTPSIHA